jgi:hypothetical protein
MNTSPDLDRQLAAWLEDGPTQAPERALDAALAHAARHPRRFDPLAFVRADPMPATRPSAIVRPLALAAALGLLLVAAFTIAAVGGLFREAPVIVPPPVASPSVAPSFAPSASVAPSPSAAPSASPAVVHVDLTGSVGQDASIDIVDRSGTLVRAVSGTPGDGGSVADGEVQIVADGTDPATLVLTWTGAPCDTTHTLTISADGRTMTIDRPACSGDSIPVDHVLRLTFDQAVDPATITGSVVTTGP